MKAEILEIKITEKWDGIYFTRDEIIISAVVKSDLPVEEGQYDDFFVSKEDADFGLYRIILPIVGNKMKSKYIEHLNSIVKIRDLLRSAFLDAFMSQFENNRNKETEVENKVFGSI